MQGEMVLMETGWFSSHAAHARGKAPAIKTPVIPADVLAVELYFCQNCRVVELYEA